MFEAENILSAKMPIIRSLLETVTTGWAGFTEMQDTDGQHRQE